MNEYNNKQVLPNTGDSFITRMLNDKTRGDAKIYMAMVVTVLRMDQQHGCY
jgi:hypothetical protein